MTPLLGVKSSSSRSAGPRRENWKKSFLSARSAGIEGQVDKDGVNILTLDVYQLHWEEKYLLLKQFKEREGHCNVPYSHKEDGINLGTWVNTQRQFKKKGKLDPERQQILADIGFEWVRVVVERRPRVPWEDIFSLLKQYQKREGHCNVPASHKEDGANLGIWVYNQRQFKKKGKLDPYRRKILEDIGFEWVLVERGANVPWEDMFSLLKRFKEREGHCEVRHLHKEGGMNLGVWVRTQRRVKKAGKIDRYRQKILEDIEFEWVLPEERARVPWDDVFSLLKQFKTREGHCNVRQVHAEDRINLGFWVNKQRQLKKKAKLDPERERRLGEIGFEWVMNLK